MAYKISWTQIALEDYNAIIDYLITNWPLPIAVRFEEMVNQKLRNLSNRPFTGIKSVKDPSIRSILFTKHNRLYYQINKNNIELLTIIDTRRNSEENSF